MWKRGAAGGGWLFTHNNSSWSINWTQINRSSAWRVLLRTHVIGYNSCHFYADIINNPVFKIIHFFNISFQIVGPEKLWTTEPPWKTGAAGEEFCFFKENLLWLTLHFGHHCAQGYAQEQTFCKQMALVPQHDTHHTQRFAHLLSSCRLWGTSSADSTDTGSGGAGRWDSLGSPGRCTIGSAAPNA